MPVSLKDYFNSQPPVKDSQFAAAVANPELAKLIPVLYPGAFPNLSAYQAAGKTRPDIKAIFLTGIPASILRSAPTNVGARPGRDAPAQRSRSAYDRGDKGYSPLGVIGGDVGVSPMAGGPRTT